VESSLVQIEKKALKELTKEEETGLVAGMAAKLGESLGENELICNKCPIPWRQDDVHGIIAGEAYNLVQAYMKETALRKRARLLLAYLLVGAPNWRSIARAKLRKMGAPLSLSFGRR
jgi:hypothetical protein